MAVNILKSALSAITKGYTAKSILTNIASKSPKYGNKINDALALGYTAQSILKKIADPNGSTSNDQYYTEHEQTLKRDRDQKRRAAVGLISTIGTVGALAGGLSSILNNNPNSSSKLPELSQNPPVPSFPTPQGFPQAKSDQQSNLFNKLDKLPDSQELNPKNTINFPVTEKIENIGGLRSSEIEKLYPQLPNTAEKMMSAGKTPEEVYSALKNSKFMNPVLKKYEEREGKSYLESLTGQSSNTPHKSIMMTSDGMIGEVSHVKDNKSILENNGKKFSANTDELQPIPKEWESINVDFSKVPESERSAPLSFVAPTEDKKQIVVRFWTKDHKPVVYIYKTKTGKPFDEETLNNISNEVDAPITNGMKFSGAWSQTGKSRGSAFFHKMNRMSQDASKENDPNLPYIFVRAPFSFEHGYQKAINKQLSHAEGKFNEFYNPKKRKEYK